MKQEEKDLLFKDLCARLSYGVKLKPVGLKHTIISYATLKGIFKDDKGYYHFDINDRDINGNILSYCSFKLGRSAIKYLPYLRPMSIMTEEEKFEVDKLFVSLRLTPIDTNVRFEKSDPYSNYIVVYQEELNEYFDWLNAHHFDYRGLIDKGLALEAPEGVYND